MTTYKNPIATVPVGTKFQEVRYNGKTYRAGDLVAFDDPDIDHRDTDRGVYQRRFVGKIEAFLLPNWSVEPGVFCTIPVGRLSLEDVEVSGEGVRPDPQSGTSKSIDQFLSSDYEKYMIVEWGEDIDGTGNDWRRTGE